jgi:arylsulfatase A-like enzyme
MRDLLLVTVDSLRYDHVSAYGYNQDTTPFICDLASKSHVFDEAYAHAGATRASFPTILTSSYPLMYGGHEMISEDRTMISEVLADAGYRVGGFHSNLFLSSDAGYGRGFDRFYDSKSDPSVVYKFRKVFRRNLSQDGVIYKTLKWAFDKTEQKAGVELGSLYTPADKLTDRAIQWIEKGDGNSPTFAWIHYMDVHHPYVPPKEHQKPFRGQDTISERHAIKLRRKMLEDPMGLTDKERSEIVDLYDAEVRFTDAEIRRLVDAARKILDDPVIIFTSDHGEELGERGEYGHGKLYEECVHVPLVINDGTGASRKDSLVGLLDVAPTLVDYADHSSPDSFCGHNLRKLIHGEDWERSRVIGEYGGLGSNHHLSYRNDRWSYISDEDGNHLYDRNEQLREQNNVIEANEEIVDTIDEELSEHVMKVETTQSDIETIEMEKEVIDRLEKLGYKME